MERKVDPCYTCRNRRIQCDQTGVPCAKCQKAGLECFDKRPVRWVKGVAIRGKMQGRSYESSSEASRKKESKTAGPLVPRRLTPSKDVMGCNGNGRSYLDPMSSLSQLAHMVSHIRDIYEPLREAAGSSKRSAILKTRSCISILYGLL